ncbi:MAG: hypothetical protein IJO75_01680 [Clostridia bacterium]|nr:hypothetical protein [Clostridia bacterium]
MAILRIRDENGQEREIVALKGEPGAGKNLPNNCAVFNDYDNNEILAKCSVGFGTNTMAGYKGFPISDVTLSADSKSMSVVLADRELEEKAHDHYAVGEYVQWDAKQHWYNIFKIIGKSKNADGNTVLQLANSSNVEITHDVALDSDPAENWLWVVGKWVGLPITNQKAVAVFGDSNIAAGRGTVAAGRGNQAIGNYSGTVGRNNKTGYCAFAGGFGNTVMGHYAFSAGCNNIAKGIFSVALGDRAKANSNVSFASGQLSEANAEGSFASGISAYTGPDAYAAAAFGLGAKAHGFASFTHGEKVTANGKYSVVFGYKSLTEADAEGAASLGNECIARGRYSAAIGSMCRANYDYSFVCGDLNSDAAPHQAVFGKFSRMTEDMVFGIGDGTGNPGDGTNEYRNAFSAYTDGHAEVRTQGTTANSVVTKQYVDGLLEQIEQLKQAVRELGGNI